MFLTDAYLFLIQDNYADLQSLVSAQKTKIQSQHAEIIHVRSFFLLPPFIQFSALSPTFAPEHSRHPSSFETFPTTNGLKSIILGTMQNIELFVSIFREIDPSLGSFQSLRKALKKYFEPDRCFLQSWRTGTKSTPQKSIILTAVRKARGGAVHMFPEIFAKSMFFFMPYFPSV